MRIGIIGMGVVGQAMAELLGSHYAITLMDRKDFKIFGRTVKNATKEEINKCDVGIICVPTPQGKDGKCDTGIVEEVLSWLTTDTIIIKSTVYPGFTKEQKVNVVFSPEYIGESTYYNPIYKTMADTDFMIFGGHKFHTQKCVDLFKPVMGPLCHFYQTDSTSAEITKYMENNFFATKIAFCNEYYDICEKYGVNYDEVREMWLADQRINRMHTAVFKDKRGFSGKCLPKDLSAMAEESGLLKQVKKCNEEVQKRSSVWSV